MSETDFIREIVGAVQAAACLLDVNNVFVSATNHSLFAGALSHGFSPCIWCGKSILPATPLKKMTKAAPLLIDAHDRPVSADVWALYESVIAVTRPCSNADRVGQ